MDDAKKQALVALMDRYDKPLIEGLVDIAYGEMGIKALVFCSTSLGLCRERSAYRGRNRRRRHDELYELFSERYELFAPKDLIKYEL